MADLGFDFSDDQDDYQTYEDGNLSTLTEKTDISTEQQYHLSNVTDDLNNAAASSDNQTNDKDDSDATDIKTFMEHQESSSGTDEQLDNDSFTKEPDSLIPSNRLLEAPNEGFSSESLLQAILTEEANESDLDDNILIDLDETLTSAERVYKFNKSNVMFYRHLVAKELPNALYEVDTNEAISEMLPVILKIAYDEDEAVRETFVSELDKIIMYFYQNAPPLMETIQATKSTLSTQHQQTLHSEQEDNDRTLMTTEQSESTKEEKQQNDNGQHGTDHVEITSSQQQLYSPTMNNTVDKQIINNNSVQEMEEKTPFVEQQRQNASNTNQIPSSEQQSTYQQPHIPAKKFSSMLIALLLDQNSNLASLGQQCIVSVAAELASTPPDSERAALDRYLLDTEIFDGVVMGLMDIVEGKINNEENDEQGEQGTKNTDNEEEGLSANLSAASLDKDSFSSSSTTTGVIRRPSATPGFESSSMTQPSDDSRQGEMNLAKMMCLSLISALTVVLGPEWATEFCLPIVERLSPDPMFYVRREAAGAIGSLATVVNADVAMNRLLPLYMNFSRDTIWHVRRSCVLALPFLCSVLPEETKTQVAIEGVELFKTDVSRNVRNTLAEVIGELIAKFLPEDWETSGKPGKVPDQLLNFFLSLGANGNPNQMFKLETDRALICAYNFPAVVLTAGADYWDSHLKDTYLSLTKDYQIKVRRTFAYSLHEIARIIGPERTERDLVQIFALYLMDLDDVKQGVLEHLAEFLGTLAVSSRNEYIPILTEVWDGVMTNWRLRDILAAQLREIALLFDAARVVEHVLPLAIRACNDEFAAVRETGVEAFPVILEIVKRAVDEEGENLSHDDVEEENEDTKESKRNFALALLNHVMERLDEFVRSDMYRGRLVFTQICRSLLDAGISAGDFASFFLSRLAPLAVDNIINVRIGTARTIRQLYLNDAYRQELTTVASVDGMENDDDEVPIQSSKLLEQMVYRLALDTDPDVRMFVLDLVDPEVLQEKEKVLLTAAASSKQHEDEEDQQFDGATDDSGMVGTPMQDIERSSTPTSSTLIGTNANESSSTGHHIMRRILSNEEENDESNVEYHHIDNSKVISTQPDEVQQRQETVESVDEHTSDEEGKHTTNMNGAVNASLDNDQHSIHNNTDDTGSDDLDDEHTSGTPMDCTEDGGQENSNKKDNHDEDGDEMMMEAERDDCEEEPAMIDDDDDEHEPTFTDEKEKGEYVYLSKSPHGSILASSPTLNAGKDTT
ncbi:armadillo-type protein [Halteromyces radiatus]|uniref:armadillo-type protein n=1 Tax=Halteromyces radiatus TaxID=101107 RepID=UPI002221033C|nr:armadillo-type protein [Halteromyces radiatus]KAI8099944.1 armadillo-type protein [Halteromyces radiatus]